MLESLSTWTTEVTGWEVIMIFSALVGTAIASYGSGIHRGVQITDERLKDVGIQASATENLITIHEPENDKVVATITWDEEWVEMTRHDLDDQQWDSEKL